MELDAILQSLSTLHPFWVVLILFLSAFIEYIFPPAPGDTLVVGGAILVSHFDWPFWVVLTATTSGASLGALVDFLIGRWIVRSGRLNRLSPKNRAILEDIVQKMRHRGAVYLAINRFLPGIRALFFLAAGLAELPLRRVLFWSTISAILWNTALVALGFTLGSQLSRLETLLSHYAIIVWALILIFAALFLIRHRRKKQR